MHFYRISCGTGHFYMGKLTFSAPFLDAAKLATDSIELLKIHGFSDRPAGLRSHTGC